MQIYNSTVTISGYTETGQPKLDQMGFVLENLFPSLDTERRYDAIHKVFFIHRELQKLRTTKEVKKDNG